MFTFAEVPMQDLSFKPRIVARWAVITDSHYYSYIDGGQRGAKLSENPLNQSNHWQ
jgi:hypothetical protein